MKNEITIEFSSPAYDICFEDETFEMSFPSETMELTLLGVNGIYMTKSVYDPQNIKGDSFLLDLHTGELNTNTVIIDGGLLG